MEKRNIRVLKAERKEHKSPKLKDRNVRVLKQKKRPMGKVMKKPMGKVMKKPTLVNLEICDLEVSSLECDSGYVTWK